MKKYFLIALMFGACRIGIAENYGNNEGIRIANFPEEPAHQYVVLSTAGATTSAAEQMQYFNQNVQGVRSQNLKTYQIPSGKTLEIQSFAFSIRATITTITWCRVTLRHSLAGGTSPNSYVVYTDEASLIGTVNAIASARIQFPQAVDFYGDGTQDIGISAVCTGAPLLDYALVGYQF